MKNKYNLIAILLIAFLVSAAFSQESKVTLSFTVLDENDNFLSGLKPSDIQISHGKKILPISSVESKTSSNLEVAIMIDASTSQERILPNGKKIAEYFIDKVLKKEQDKVAIVKFTGSVSLEQDLTNNFIKAKEQIGKITFEPPDNYVGGGIIFSPTPPSKNSATFAKGSTSIWDSIKQVVQTLASVKPNNSRRVIILISDGVNTFGETKLKEVIDFSVKNQIPIFAIGIGDDYYEGVDKKTLKKLTEQTSGMLVLPKENLDNMPKLMKRLEQRLRSIYQITFAPIETDSKDILREIKIEIVSPELRKRKLQIVQSKGYFTQ